MLPPLKPVLATPPFWRDQSRCLQEHRFTFSAVHHVDFYPFGVSYMSVHLFTAPNARSDSDPQLVAADVLAPNPKSNEPLDLFMTKLKGNWESGCWEWSGYKKEGYGHFTSRGVTYMAHRWAWANVAGLTMPEGDLDHICNNRSCVRPGHLQPTSRRLNILLRDERANFRVPEGKVLRGPIRHRSLAESMWGVYYGLPTAFTAMQQDHMEEIVEAVSVV